jgi:hypothetical protein
MKQRNELSGIFFRNQNPETKKWEDVVFEDLEENEQDAVMLDRDIVWLKSLCKSLAKTINEIAKVTGVTKVD